MPMRLFVALELPAEVREKFGILIQEMSARSTGKQVRWIRAQNLHVTLKFIGSVSADQVAPIVNNLSGVRSTESVELKFRGLSFFPNEKGARVLWAGVDASPNLNTLAADIDDAVGRISVVREQRSFKPHLTLARFQPPGVPPAIRDVMQENANREFGALCAREFHLIESKLKSTGAEYTTLQSFRFVVGA